MAEADANPPDLPHPARRRRTALFLLAACVLAAAGAALAVVGPWGEHEAERHPPPAGGQTVMPADPRLTYAGPYRNVRPEVPYVGTAACAKCHEDVAAAYRQHPMGRSLAPVAAVASLRPYDRAHNNPFEALGSRFLVDRQGDRVWHRQTRLDADRLAVYERASEAHYVIGSGARGHSYLTDRGGYLFQTPISWFGQKEIWDLSPGFKPQHVTSRPVGADCLFCHADRALYREGSVNRYDPPVFAGHAIGCERCHGPGERHARSEEPLDIVNPGKLGPALRDAVCEQCHLEGAARVVRRGLRVNDFRPGLPLDAALAVFVHARETGEGQKAVNHVEQMHLSRCYEASAGARKLGCVSCHDPHRAVKGERQLEWYRARCLKCHTDQACTAPAADRRDRRDDCAGCHMPRYAASNIPHTASTDHRIPRRPGRAAGTPSHPRKGFAVVPYGRPADSRDPELARDLGVALVMLMAKGELDPALHGTRALGLLEAATARDPVDGEAWLALATALMMRGEPHKAQTAFESGLEKAPHREALVTGAAKAAQRLGEGERALAYWRRAVAANPWMPDYRANLAQVLARNNDWDAVRDECKAWVGLEPESVPARLLWVDCLLRAGEREEARAEFARIERLRPPDLDRLRKWFADQGK